MLTSLCLPIGGSMIQGSPALLPDDGLQMDDGLRGPARLSILFVPPKRTPR